MYALCYRRSVEDAEEGYQEAEAALEIMEEAEAEEAELEEVEDLLEYYLQRATTTQSEAERLLAGSRDLEESIGVSLSARRFEVCPLLCMSYKNVFWEHVSSTKLCSGLMACHASVLLVLNTSAEACCKITDKFQYCSTMSVIKGLDMI